MTESGRASTTLDCGKPAAVFFDAGGTLLHPTPSVGAVYAEVARRWGVNCNAAALDHAFKAGFQQAAWELRNRILTRGKYEDEWDDLWIHESHHAPQYGWSLFRAKYFWREAVHKTFMFAGGVAAELADSDDFNVFFHVLYEEFGRAQRYSVAEGAIDVLTALADRSIATGILSNWDHRLRGIIAGGPLNKMVDHIVVSCEVGYEKPNPGIFYRAIDCVVNRVGTEYPYRYIWHVGDSWEADVLGARAAGMTPVWFSDKTPPDDSVLQIGDLRELLDLIEL